MIRRKAMKHIKVGNRGRNKYHCWLCCVHSAVPGTGRLWSLPLHPQHITPCLTWFPLGSYDWSWAFSCFRCSVWRTDPTEETEEAGRRSGSDSCGASKPSKSAKPFPQTDTGTAEHDKKARGSTAAVQPALLHRQAQSDGKYPTSRPRISKSEVWGVAF